jgi:hypothetical protein
MRILRTLIPAGMMLGMLALPIPSNYGFGHIGHHRVITPNAAHLPGNGGQEQGQRPPEVKNERPVG